VAKQGQIMRRLIASAVCGLAFCLVTSAWAAQPQVKYNFTGTDFTAKPRAVVTAPAPQSGVRTTAFGGVMGGYTSGYSGKQTVKFDRKLAPGTVLIRTGERKLYYVLEGGKAIQYGIGVGREGFTWKGRKRISRKAEWPGWTPPARMIEREKAKGIILPAYMPGGPNNPLGARALYLGGSLYRIHGTNQAHTIGHAVSSGCIRMLNEEVTELYDRVKIGTLVIVE
jgi:lipoprotein-anchoring transpeptidase ErfK/SrfK